MLDFIEAVFWNKGKSDYLRYDGNLNTDRKATVVRQFQEVTNNKRILLCSTKAGNCGLNLTAAYVQFLSLIFLFDRGHTRLIFNSNRIILFEPDYNPYVEDQAVDRCHRIGQKKEVFVTRKS